MMKTFRLFSMAALALMMAACSSEDNTLETQSPAAPGKLHFTATIEAPRTGATTRTEYTEITSGVDAGKINVKWKVGDEIALCHNSKKDVVTVKTVNDDGSATIDGTIDATGTDGEDVQLVYPASVVTAVSGSTPTSVLNFLSQDGTREYIAANLDHRVGHGQLAISGGNASLKAQVTMQGDKAIWKLSLTDGTNPLSATAVTLKVGTTTIAQAASEAKSVYYLCVVPAKMGSGDFTIEATDGSDTYTYTKAGGISLAEGKYYQSTVTMAKEVAATSLSELKTAINGGKDCSSYIGWEVNSAGDIAESGISGTKIGYVAYVSTSDVDANVSGSRILVIASADAAATTLTWGSDGTARGLEDVEDANDLKGYSNTNTLQGYGSEAHPAAYAAWNYSATIPSGGATPAHWFMPTMKQWKNMRDAKGGAYSAMATAYGIADQYWTSNEYFNGKDDSECKNFAWRFASNSTFMSYRKSFDIKVRSIFAY